MKQNIYRPSNARHFIGPSRLLSQNRKNSFSAGQQTLKFSLCFIVLGLVFGPQHSNADRSVSVAVGEGVLELTNGSPETVTYSVECYDKVNGTNLTPTASSVTLLAKKSIQYMSGGLCANGTAPTYKHSSGVIACAGNTPLAGAASSCGPQSTLCTLPQLATRGVTNLTGFPHQYWFTSGQATWYHTWDNWVKSNPYNETGGKGKNYAPRTYTDSKGNASYRCHTATGNTGDGIGFCQAGDDYSTGFGSLCCPNDNGFKSCKVTIHSATPAAGYLQSPQFKGGSPF